MFKAIVSLKLDNRAIQAKIQKALANSPAVRRAAYDKAYGLFKQAKRRMLAEFDRHPITQELNEGPEAVNMSGTLGGYGNLFSFIGFPEGDNPTEPLRSLLEQTDFKQTVYRNGSWYFKVILPTREAIENATQMPWELGNSWAFAVERDISGLSHYMYKKWEAGRSGMGIQLPYENLEDATFTGKPYITEILNHFRERLNQNE